ncbi:MAG: ATP-binding cassette domain-containing protein [Methylococcales bacterium]|nr:ATP-binding cassette domain-containing protein [Methylococcales bacterium]
MIRCSNLTLRRGALLLLDHTDLTLNPGWKVGITGANGTGKSSFFALIMGKLSADQGDCQVPEHWQVAHVAQETPALERSATDYVIDGDAELRRLQQRLREAETAADGIAIAELHGELERIEGYSADARARRLLAGLGFTQVQLDLPVASFSGGWRMRLNLAQALMCRSDLLLLDEPTNHLDLEAVIWLQNWLAQYPGTLLLISHDREFLDAVTDHIIHFEHQKACVYTGNYSAFEQIRAEQLAGQDAAYARQQREIAHIQHFVERFKAKATKAKQAQSRLKALARMDIIAKAQADSPFEFHFAPPEALSNPLLQLQNARIGYGQTVIVDDVDFSLSPGDRIGLLGANGTGKSSLIKVLAGEHDLLAGNRLEGAHLRIGYFAQHQLEQLRGGETPLWHIQRLTPEPTEQEARNFLGGFGFTGDTVQARVGRFSGGEKARLVLALLVYQNPNLLLLDEPTNHLDLAMREALILALQDYQGALIVVSHDRHLLRSVVDQFHWLHESGMAPFPGDLDDYRKALAETQKNTENSLTQETTTPNRKQQRQLDAQRRQRMQPLRKALTEAERAMEQWHQRQQAIEQTLADTELYQPEHKARLHQLLEEKRHIDQALAEAENTWLAAEEALNEFEHGHV